MGVVQQFVEHFGHAILKLADQLVKGEPGRTERAGKVEESRRHVEIAVAHEAACQEQLEAAKASLKEAEVVKKTAERSIEDFDKEIQEVAANAEFADALLMACKDDVATFIELVEGSAPASATAHAKVNVAVVAAVADEVLSAATLSTTSVAASPAEVANEDVAPVPHDDVVATTVPDVMAPKVSVDAPDASILNSKIEDSQGSACLSYAFGGL